MVLVEETASMPREKVTAPVEALTKSGAVAVVDETKLEPREFCLVLKVFQSTDER